MIIHNYLKIFNAPIVQCVCRKDENINIRILFR